MPGEIPSHQPNPHELGPNPAADAAASIVMGREVSADGARQLAGDVVGLMETGGSSAVSERLSAALADKEGLVPPSERTAVFGFLASEQRGEIRRSLIEAGGRMLDNLSAGTQRASGVLQHSAPQAGRGIQMILEAPKQLEPHLRGQSLDKHRIGYTQEAAMQGVRQGFSPTTTYVELLSGWARAQQQEVEGYREQVQRGSAHERALDEASKVVKPGYEGEPKDLSRVIDESVKEAAVTKLQSAIAEARASGGSPEDAVLEFLAQEPDDNSVKIIRNLSTFSEQYAPWVMNDTQKVEGAKAESGRLLESFAAIGNGYQGVNRVEDAVGLYQQQGHSLRRAAESANAAVRFGLTIVERSRRELLHKQQELSRVRQHAATATAEVSHPPAVYESVS